MTYLALFQPDRKAGGYVRDVSGFRLRRNGKAKTEEESHGDGAGNFWR